MRVLCVAEKPSIAKAVAEILGGGRVSRRESRIKYIKNYDFTFNFGNGSANNKHNLGSCEVTMTSVLGHLTSLDFPPEFGWSKCRPIELFTAPVVTFHNKQQQQVANNIATEAQRCDRLMIWTDCDREGEHIGFEIMEAARKKNSRINSDNVLRAQFAHLERAHVVQAAKNPKKLDMGQVDAVATRIELDLRSGYAFTRLLSNSLGNVIQQRGERETNMISYGSCQFPTLGFIVDRYKRVRSFVPESFWYIQVTTLKNRIKTDFNWTRPHMFDQLAVVAYYANAMDETNPNSDKAVIKSKQERPTSNYKPLPLTTVELQKQASRSFKFTAKETLKIAEDLYTKGFISYPRTETDRFPAKMDLKKLVENQFPHPTWGSYAKSLIEQDLFRQPRGGKHNDEAHPPIHPIAYSDGRSFNAKEKKIHELVVRHFLACCSDDAKGSQTTVTLQWGPETFTTSALEVKLRNYLDIYPYRQWKTTAKKIPSFEIGEEVKLAKAEIKTGKTSPPEYMTESELIALMDANGIGTDATIGEHIDKVTSRDYVTPVKQNSKTLLVPSEIGMALVQGFDKIELNDNISLTKPYLRRSLEDELREICDKRKTKREVLGEINGTYSLAFQITERQSQTLIRAYDDVKRENAGQ